MRAALVAGSAGELTCARVAGSHAVISGQPFRRGSRRAATALTARSAVSFTKLVPTSLATFSGTSIYYLSFLVGGGGGKNLPLVLILEEFGLGESQATLTPVAMLD